MSRTCGSLVHNQLLSAESGFVELSSCDNANLSELFNCVKLNNLSVTDIQRTGRVCQELSEILQTIQFPW